MTRVIQFRVMYANSDSWKWRWWQGRINSSWNSKSSVLQIKSVPKTINQSWMIRSCMSISDSWINQHLSFIGLINQRHPQLLQIQQLGIAIPDNWKKNKRKPDNKAQKLNRLGNRQQKEPIKEKGKQQSYHFFLLLIDRQKEWSKSILFIALNWSQCGKCVCKWISV